MTYRLRNILIALALATVAALLTTFYVSNYKKHVQRQQAKATVVVATNDIPVGLTGPEILKGHFLTTQSVGRDAVVPGALSDPNQVAAQVAKEPIYAGEQVTQRRFGAKIETGISGQISNVYRAIQVAGDPNQLLIGTLEDGDHVDILANIKIKSPNGDRSVTRIVLRDIKVLRVSNSSGNKVNIGSTTPQNWVQLAVTDNQSQKLYWVMKNADMTLELRPVIHAADSPNSVETVESVLGDGLKLNDYVQITDGKGPSR